jgi:hypothetical protein
MRTLHSKSSNGSRLDILLVPDLLHQPRTALLVVVLNDVVPRVTVLVVDSMYSCWLSLIGTRYNPYPKT